MVSLQHISNHNIIGSRGCPHSNTYTNGIKGSIMELYFSSPSPYGEYFTICKENIFPFLCKFQANYHAWKQNLA